MRACAHVLMYCCNGVNGVFVLVHVDVHIMHVCMCCCGVVLVHVACAFVYPPDVFWTCACTHMCNHKCEKDRHQQQAACNKAITTAWKQKKTSMQQQYKNKHWHVAKQMYWDCNATLQKHQHASAKEKNSACYCQAGASPTRFTQDPSSSISTICTHAEQFSCMSWWLCFEHVAQSLPSLSTHVISPDW